MGYSLIISVEVILYCFTGQICVPCRFWTFYNKFSP